MSILQVWVVDDEPLMCQGVQRSLSDHEIELDDIEEKVSFEVTTFPSAEDFFEAYKNNKPNILLLDVKLPGIDGVQVLEQLSEEKSGVLTIMITAYASLDKVVKAIKLGAYDFLAKPFTPNEIRSTIKKAAYNIVLSQKMHEMQLEKRKIRFELISVVSHELKSPINAIDGYVDILQSSDLAKNPQVLETSLERISKRINDMRKLILDLLDLTRIESGIKKRDLEDIDLIALINELLGDVTQSAEKANITLNFHPDVACSYYADRSEMEIIFKNLLSNAIKYNRVNGTLDISFSESEEKYHIAFKDTGIGIAKEDIARLFKDFSRIKNEKTRNISGSGLGLSIINKIVERYNGSIDVESIIDQGTTFTVTLPKLMNNERNAS